LTDCGQVNLVEVEQFLEYLGGIEDQVFKNRLEREAKKRAELDEVRSREESQSLQPQAGSSTSIASPVVKRETPAPAQASDTQAWHAQLLAQSFSMELDTIENATDAPKVEEMKREKPQSGKFVDKEFHQALKERLEARQDLGVSMADTVRLGEGPHWKQRYYFEKFKVKQDDLIDFLQRIRKAYIEGLAWVLVYYYQGCQSWTWFYPYHYAPFASDLIGCSNLKCGEVNYFSHGRPFQPFQQLMSVLPPVSASEAGIPAAMRELMNQPFSPLIDFYPADFGLDLNGKRFTWQAVILLPFIDEPRLVRILAPLLKRLQPNEKVRNRRGSELLFGHKDDKSLAHQVQLVQAAFEAGHVGVKQALRGGGLHKSNHFGFIEGWAQGGANREVVSPIEGLPDVEESHAISAQYQDPEVAPHVSKLLPGIREAAVVINAADMDEANRMKGFGGEPAKRMILQALGKDPEAAKGRVVKTTGSKQQQAPKQQQQQQQAPKPKAQASLKRPQPPAWQEEEEEAPSATLAAPVAGAADEGNNLFDYEEDEDEFAGAKTPAAPAPPAGTKVIRVRAAGKFPRKQ